MRKFSRLTIIVMAMTVIMAILAGCGKTDSTSSAATRTLTYKDQTYTVPAKPERMRYLPIPYSISWMPLMPNPSAA